MDELPGDPGWVGPAVVLLNLDLDDPSSRVVAHVHLDEDGRAVAESSPLFESWVADGIVGRAEMGRLYPKDGQAFLDELPFVYRGAYLRAVPETEVMGDTW